MTRTLRGFSLIEMAFVLIIVTLLLGGLLVPFATQVEQKRIAETQKALEEIKEALLGFAVANGRLPCPDNATVVSATANNGEEDACSAGVESEGSLPWATLGVGAADAWGNRLRYRVTNVFTIAGGFPLGTNGTIRACPTAACTSSVAALVPAVVLSHGKNGFGSINANTAVGVTTRIPCPGTPPVCSADETENIDNDNNFVQRTLTPATTPAGEFDDQVVWLSPNILFNRMVAAGRLP